MAQPGRNRIVSWVALVLSLALIFAIVWFSQPVWPAVAAWVESFVNGIGDWLREVDPG
ncbi:MAG: hypothetical protein QM607_06425 [Microbacterium sp.]